MARDQPATIPRCLERALSLSTEAVPVLAPVITLMLKSLLCSYQADHHTALDYLKQAWTLLRKREGEEKDAWQWGMKAVLLYDLAAESMNVFLRAEAIKYIIRAKAVIDQHPDCSAPLQERINAYKAHLVPAALPSLEPFPSEITLGTYQSVGVMETIGETLRGPRGTSQRKEKSSRERLRTSSRTRQPTSHSHRSNRP